MIAQTTTSRDATRSAEGRDFTNPRWGDARQVGHIFGISRSVLYRLMSTGKVRSVSLTEDGAVRGKRLFDLYAIAEMLEARAEGGCR